MNVSLRICASCGSIFEGRAKQIYCSKTCPYGKQYPRIRQRVCVACEQVFEVQTRQGSGVIKTCSMECWRRHKTNNERLHHPLAQLRPITCLTCGNIFQGKGRRATCSQLCQAERATWRFLQRYPRVTRTCVVCRKPYANNYQNSKTCSAECSQIQLWQRAASYRGRRRDHRVAYEQRRRYSERAALETVRELGIAAMYKDRSAIYRALKAELPTLTT